MLGIDPHIVEHEIKNCLDASYVRHRLHAMNPHKEPATGKSRKVAQGWLYLYGSLD